LFGFQQPETRGERIFGYAFEAFVLICTLKYAWGWSLHVQALGDVVLPLGIANYIDVSVLFGSPLAYVVAGVLTLGVALGALRRWRYGYLVALFLLHVLFAARYSQGEIPHSSNVLAMTLMGFALASVAFDREMIRRRFSLGFAYFFVGLGYTLAAYCKLIGTGITWPDGRHLIMWTHEKAVDVYAAYGTTEMNVVKQLVLDHYEIATAFLVIGLVTELFAFLMWWPRFRILIGLGVLGLHAGIYFTMSIVFSITTIELILLTIPAVYILNRVLGTRNAQGWSNAPLASPLAS